MAMSGDERTGQIAVLVASLRWKRGGAPQFLPIYGRRLAGAAAAGAR
jgi:hypothetical protein